MVHKQQRLKPQILRSFGRRFVGFKAKNISNTLYYPFCNIVVGFSYPCPMRSRCYTTQVSMSRYLQTKIYQSSREDFGSGGLAYPESILVLRRDTTSSYQMLFPSRGTIEVSKASKYACIRRMCSSMVSSAEVC